MKSDRDLTRRVLAGFATPAPSARGIDFADAKQRAAAANAVAGRLHMTTGVCRDRAQVIARDLLDVAQAAALAAQTQES